MTGRQINGVERASIGKFFSDSFLRLKQTFSRVDRFEFGFPNVEIEKFSLDIGAKPKILLILWDKLLC